MSLSDRRFLLRSLLAIGGLGMTTAGCFKPMLAKNTEASDMRGRIALPPVDGRMGYHLHQSLEEQLGRPTVTDWRLAVRVTTVESGFAVTQNSSTTRISVTATADWQLYKNGTPQPVYSSKSVSTSAYNAADSLYSIRQAKIDVERRLAEDLGKRIGRAVLGRAKELTAES
ncbi:hypothetical protein KHP62_11335 [Rhodobacteraceae bacterium NNCM2]|nr:hypothetical protein [Coraliihabitans acroporae]